MATRKKKESWTPEEIEALAVALVPILITQVRAHHHEFWIDPKSHYDEHQGLRDMLTEYQKAKGIFWRAFIWILAAGAAALSAIGAVQGWFHGR